MLWCTITSLPLFNGELNNKGVELDEIQTLFLNRNSDAYAMTYEDANTISGLLASNIDIMSRSKTKFSEEVDRRKREEDVDVLKDGAEGRLKNIFKMKREILFIHINFQLII